MKRVTIQFSSLNESFNYHIHVLLYFMDSCSERFSFDTCALGYADHVSTYINALNG